MLRQPATEHTRRISVVYNPENLQTSNTAEFLTRKKRVAAYARVSTLQDEQQNSYEAQINYYTGYIQARPEWEFVGIYADEGITGTNTKHRKEFNRMIEDALNGQIDLILTKSVSRFCRNTVDALNYTRQLKAKGVEVFFEEQGISSLNPNMEMILTFMSSMAQDESRIISENVRWGLMRSMENGKVNIPYKSFLGYEKGPDGLPKIVEAEATIVREIYQLFLDGYSLNAIAERMMEEGHLTARKKTRWTKDGIRRILTNEKYKGDARLQKTYTVDFLTKEVRVNNGERKQWYIHDSHDAIVTPETFELVQIELKRRTGRKGKFYDSPFTGKIVCGDCGAFYGHRVWHSNNKYRRNIWLCNDKYDNGVKCLPPRVTEEEIKAAFLIAINRILDMENCYTSSFEEKYLAMIADTQPLESEKDAVMEQVAELSKQIERLMHENATHVQDQTSYLKKFNELTGKLDEKRAEVTMLEARISELLTRKKNVLVFLEGLQKVDGLMTKFEVSTWHALVETVTVMADHTLEFHMRDGSTMSVSMEEAKRRK